MENICVIDEVPEEYLCHVCNNVMLQPLVLECGHTYCHKCIKRIEEGVLRHCPVCRRRIYYHHCNFVVKQVVDRLKGKCTLCNKEETIGALTIHVCPEEDITCANNGCEHHLKRKDREHHEGECPHRNAKCGGCGKEILALNMAHHVKNECPHAEIACSLTCGEKIKRNEIHLHMENCTKRRRPCSIPGCHFWGDSDEMAEHDTKRALQHVRLLKESEEQLKDALLNKKTDMLYLKREKIRSFEWSIGNFKRVVSRSFEEALPQREPLTSPTTDAHGCKWRLVLYLARKCSLYLQLVSAVTSIRVGIRFVIKADDPSKDEVFTEEPLLLTEGKMYGAEIQLSTLEKIAEGTKDLNIKVIIETVCYKVTDDDN